MNAQFDFLFEQTLLIHILQAPRNLFCHGRVSIFKHNYVLNYDFYSMGSAKN